MYFSQITVQMHTMEAGMERRVVGGRHYWIESTGQYWIMALASCTHKQGRREANIPYSQ